MIDMQSVLTLLFVFALCLGSYGELLAMTGDVCFFSHNSVSSIHDKIRIRRYGRIMLVIAFVVIGIGLISWSMLPEV